MQHCHPTARIPLYTTNLLGVTHILGGAGLLIPKLPRLTEWVYAGLTINLLLGFYSRLNVSGNAWDKLDPIVVMAVLFASYVLRRRMRKQVVDIDETYAAKLNSLARRFVEIVPGLLRDRFCGGEPQSRPLIWVY